jgi:hypothetical protein
MTETVTPSDVLHLLLIDYFLLISRKDENEIEKSHAAGVLHPEKYIYPLLCYLVKTITYQTTYHYDSVKSFQMKWLLVMTGKNEEDKRTLYSMLFLLLEKGNDLLLSFDAFFSFLENIKSYFENSNQNTDNALCGPNRISNNSSLGLFLRKIIALWSVASFPQQCNLYEKWRKFLLTSDQYTLYQCSCFSDEAVRAFYFPLEVITDENPSNGRKFPKNDTGSPNLVSYLNEVEFYLKKKDFSRVEDTIHDYFDTVLTNNYPVMLFSSSVAASTEAIPVGNGDNINSNSLSSYEIERNMKDLSSHKRMNNYSALKHQHSMISLATMWITAKNYPFAYSAIEEALKTSHQRGDHATVIKCLLLLYEIYSVTNSSSSSASGNGSLKSNPNELLHRCIEKSGNLHLKDVFNESLLKFVESKITNAALSSHFRVKSKDVAASGNWSISHIINLLSFVCYNETSLSLKYYSLKRVDHLDDTTAGVGTTAGGVPLPNQQKAAITPLERLPLNYKYFRHFMKLCMLTNNLYHRTMTNNSIDIILMNYYRLFSQYGKYYSFHENSVILSHFLLFCLEEIFSQRSHKSGERDEKVWKNVLCPQLIKLFKTTTAFNNKMKHLSHVFKKHKQESCDNEEETDQQNIDAIQTALDCYLLFILILTAIAKKEYSHGLVLAERVMTGLDIPLHVVTRSDDIYEKTTFTNSVLSLEETLRFFLLYRFLKCKVENCNFEIEKIFLLKICDHYQVSYIVSESIFVFLMGMVD